MYMEDDNLYKEEDGNGRLNKHAALGFGIVVLVCMVSLVSWSVYRGCTRGLMREEVRWSDADAMPWEEHKWLMYDEKLGGGRPETYEGQPDIIEGLTYEAELHKGGKTYGEIKLVVRRDGTVAGEWSGEFIKSARTRLKYGAARDKERGHRSNSFKGNIVKTKIYSDEEGQDGSKLYFIAMRRPELLLTEYNYQVREGRSIKEDVYVTGWIGSDYNVEGKLHVCWTDLIEAAKQKRLARELGDGGEGSVLFAAPDMAEVFEWEGTPER
ncbi:MAG: hypothetical protein JSV99_11715 [Planctomycetota bacterium]|nr:MAG: hypothetical protein JSV99_11715 [Planctomycetota bacterium]